MNSIDKNPSSRLRQQRAAIDGAMSRDRGRLLGMLSRCQAKPQDAALAATFEQALQASVQRRQSSPVSGDTSGSTCQHRAHFSPAAGAGTTATPGTSNC